mmetsp:Transcript_19618/g.24194  ORF Transcript_19618/g.24194 Transcript_19618/m.24194 type:complete len:263 (+) Transcript_19618:112-900(+)
MGCSPSKQRQGTPSTSRAYGRLAISSPDYRLNSPSYLQQLRRNNQHSPSYLQEGPFVRSGSESKLNFYNERHSYTEKSLLLSENGHRRFLLEPENASSGTKSSFDPNPIAPPLVQWIGPALLCALAYALYNIFIKKGSASIHPILGGVILQFVAAILGSVLCLTLVYGPTQEEIFYDSNGVWFAIYAGISVGLAEIISFMISGMGVQAVQSIPTIIGGSVFFGTILGWLLLNEDLSATGWLGVAMIAGGIALVGMDPSASLH